MSSPLIERVAESAVRWLRLTIEHLPAMPQPKRRLQETFGRRAARLRKARGLTQRDLGKQIGLSYRMVAYYESQTDRPPVHVLPDLARALGVGVDELLGARPVQGDPFEADVRVWRRLQKIQSLPLAKRKAVLQVLDALLDQHGSRDTA